MNYLLFDVPGYSRASFTPASLRDPFQGCSTYSVWVPKYVSHPTPFLFNLDRHPEIFICDCFWPEHFEYSSEKAIHKALNFLGLKFSWFREESNPCSSTNDTLNFPIFGFVILLKIIVVVLIAYLSLVYDLICSNYQDNFNPSDMPLSPVLVKNSFVACNQRVMKQMSTA